jgi:hypothetical protein
MAANTSAEALTLFLNTTPDPGAVERDGLGAGELLDVLGSMLAGAGSGGRPIAEVMAQSNLSRGAFLDLLSRATSGGLVEVVSDNGVQSLRLSPMGASLFNVAYAGHG